ncbi:MAG: F0F1 ATP synthase subunit B [Clostridiales bacterium]|nr:F0F1 ATP synthase subunit B [Clostridiales bacterium]MDY3763519.1 F0F1 ATP synthase subunit B [Candidatus Ventricola sp.]MCI6587801.1 F0F1 ATP synthase subunit B [Clostridiales bacterium]MCI7705289.1 F0F1 ATP synthase subunit B [Clostridiales bacterium]MDY3831970.1 F0F1 ATP synthase subunit B [Candidatus Ventricola sp.]
MDLYQSLVTVNPVTLIAQICNLFLQMFLVKVFFLDKIKAIIDARREAADKEITDARTAKEEAMVIKATYEQNMLESKAEAEKILQSAQQTAAKRGEQIISDAQKTAVAMKQRAEAEIAQEKKRVLNETKDEISEIAMAIAGKVVGRELTASDHAQMVDSFIDKLGDEV